MNKLNYSYRLGTSEHDKEWGVKRHMWIPHLRKWGSIDPLDPVAPRPLNGVRIYIATVQCNECSFTDNMDDFCPHI